MPDRHATWLEATGNGSFHGGIEAGIKPIIIHEDVNPFAPAAADGGVHAWEQTEMFSIAYIERAP